MRYLILILLLVGCRSAKVQKQSEVAKVDVTENKAITEVQIIKKTDSIVEVEIVPINEDKEVVITDQNGKVTKVKNAKVKYTNAKRKQESVKVFEDKTKTTVKAEQKQEKKDVERKVPIHYQFIFWFIILIILFVIYLQRTFKFQLWR
jgi:ABC-type Na+ efflux pump permease subunit